MTVGVVVWELHIAGCQSLKDKRQVVKSLKDRLHHRFNVSGAETGHHDLHQRASSPSAWSRPTGACPAGPLLVRHDGGDGRAGEDRGFVYDVLLGDRG
jgi:hypothetical protein